MRSGTIEKVSSKATAPLATYWQRTQWPLQSLIFMLPLIVAYELGLLVLGASQVMGQGKAVVTDIYARSLMLRLFGWFGAGGAYFPGLILITVLLVWHVIRRDPWRLDFHLYLWMWVESLLWSLPLFVLMMVLFRIGTPAAAMVNANRAAGLPPGVEGFIFSIGAGIYEELLFRLVAIAALHALLVDVLALPEKFGAPASVLLAALAFALYHFTPLEMRQLTGFDAMIWLRLIFYLFAGVYLGLAYLVRGLGIAVGAHALFDIMVTLLIMQQQAGA